MRGLGRAARGAQDFVWGLGQPGVQQERNKVIGKWNQAVKCSDREGEKA